MKSYHGIFLAIACLQIAALACQAVMGVNDLLKDDFSSNRWGTGTDSDSAIEYSNDSLQMIVFSENYFVWSTPNDEDYQNVHLEVTAINNETHPNTAFGLICDQQVAVGTFYYFAMSPARQYAIAKTIVAQADQFLTNNDAWAFSDLIVEEASSYRIGADCGNGRLTMYVDGQQIASVSDSTFTEGGVALFTWSDEDGSMADVSFDDFLMTELP